jgi:hypothetical protein
MKFKLDENLSQTLAALFGSEGHDAHSIVEQSLSEDHRVRIHS